MRKLEFLATAIIVVFLTSPAHAYIGPGLGAGAIGAVLGILAAIGLALFAIVWYPLKRMMKKKKSKQPQQQNKTESGTQ